MPIQIVGTPAATVTCSLCIRSSRLGGSRYGPGNTSFAPVIAHTYGRPHALTWNIGTTGSNTSVRATFNESGSATTSVCKIVERCEYTTPFGRPVVPLV